jgi:hypothetical protein
MFTVTALFFQRSFTRTTSLSACLATETMPGLMARAKTLEEEGLAAFIWSGGYNVPLTGKTGGSRRRACLNGKISDTRRQENFALWREIITTDGK